MYIYTLTLKERYWCRKSICDIPKHGCELVQKKKDGDCSARLFKGTVAKTENNLWG